MALSFSVDGFRLVYIAITLLLWALSSIFSVGYFKSGEHTARYHVFSALTLLSVIGVFLSADLLTTFIFFELLSLLSYPMVVHDETKPALRAGETYLAVSIIGGMSALMGLLLLRSLTGTLDIRLLREAYKTVDDTRMLYISGALMLVGFGAKAGLFPLHIWLPQAHPVAPAPASALLSGILTKCGMFGVIVLSCEIFSGDTSWSIALLAIGLATMLVGAVRAVFSVDIKRTLACSSVSQMGFIAVGVAMQGILGEHNALAVRGTILHMVNHSVFKLLLFLLAGVIYMNVHSTGYDKIRGFARRKPLFAAVFIISALGIAGVPYFSGYVSKTLLHESIVEGVHMQYADMRLIDLLRAAEALFIFTGGLTAAYMIKLGAVLFGKRKAVLLLNPAQKEAHGKRPPALLFGVLAVVVPVFGSFPRIMESLAAYCEGFMHGHAPEHEVHYFAWENIKGAVFSLAIGALVYIIIRITTLRKDADGNTAYVGLQLRFLDLENMLYRPLIKGIVLAGAFFARVAETLPDAFVSLIKMTLLRPLKQGRFPGKFFGRYYLIINPEKDDEPPARTVVRAGFSVGLLLFGVGLCAMLVYLMFIAFN